MAPKTKTDLVMDALRAEAEAQEQAQQVREALLLDRLAKAENAAMEAAAALARFEGMRATELVGAARTALLAELAAATPAVSAAMAGHVTLAPALEPMDPTYVQDETGKRLAVALAHPARFPLAVVTGPSGAGKTFPAEQELRRLGRRYVLISCHAGTTARSLLQRTRAVNGSTIETDGPVTLAARNGWAVVVDEYDKADPRELASIQQLFSGRPIILDDGQLVDPQPGFQSILTGNGLVDESGLYAVTRTSTDLANRAFLIRAGYPAEPTEIEAYRRATGCDPKLAAQARRGVQALRGLADKGALEAAPSIRTGIRYLLVLASGCDSPQAWRSAILDGLRPSQAKAGQDALALAKAW